MYTTKRKYKESKIIQHVLRLHVMLLLTVLLPTVFSGTPPTHCSGVQKLKSTISVNGGDIDIAEYVVPGSNGEALCLHLTKAAAPTDTYITIRVINSMYTTQMRHEADCISWKKETITTRGSCHCPWGDPGWRLTSCHDYSRELPITPAGYTVIGEDRGYLPKYDIRWCSTHESRQKSIGCPLGSGYDTAVEHGIIFFADSNRAFKVIGDLERHITLEICEFDVLYNKLDCTTENLVGSYNSFTFASSQGFGALILTLDKDTFNPLSTIKNGDIFMVKDGRSQQILEDTSNVYLIPKEYWSSSSADWNKVCTARVTKGISSYDFKSLHVRIGEAFTPGRCRGPMDYELHMSLPEHKNLLVEKNSLRHLDSEVKLSAIDATQITVNVPRENLVEFTLTFAVPSGTVAANTIITTIDAVFTIDSVKCNDFTDDDEHTECLVCINVSTGYMIADVFTSVADAEQVLFSAGKSCKPIQLPTISVVQNMTEVCVKQIFTLNTPVCYTTNASYIENPDFVEGDDPNIEEGDDPADEPGVIGSGLPWWGSTGISIASLLLFIGLILILWKCGCCVVLGKRVDKMKAKRKIASFKNELLMKEEENRYSMLMKQTNPDSNL